MTWTALTYAFGSKLTSTKMTQNQDNFAAVANGDAGAPNIQTAGIADLAVTNAKIGNNSVDSAKITPNGVVTSNITDANVTYAKLAVNSVIWGKINIGLQASSGTANAWVLFTGSGQTLGWAVINTGSVAHNTLHVEAMASTQGTWGIGLYDVSGGGMGYTFNANYINSSPPWDMGDGEIPLFVFAEVRPDSSIARVDIADAPPWGYNGPTSVLAIREDSFTGKKFRRVKQVTAEFGTLAAARASGLTQAQILNRLMTDATVEEEITQTIKNRDMNLIPHPFGMKQDPANTILLLDPVSPLVRRLTVLHNEPALDEKLSKLIMDGRFNISNTALARAAPPGVLVVSASLK